MKLFFISLTLIFATLLACAHGTLRIHQADGAANKKIATNADSLQLMIDSTNAYYQKVVKVDSNIMESMIYERALQFFAAKNFQQNYGDEQEGKLIYTTTQDLNTSRIYIGDDMDPVDPFTAQFSITLDLKNRRYRYTISNVVIYRPAEDGNRRLTLYDIYEKATNTDSKRIAKDAKKVQVAFEKYISALITELYRDIEQKSAIHSPKF